MVVVPAVMPVTTPDASIEPTAGALLLQVPPLTVLVRVTVRPVHTLVEPDMVPAVGEGFTVTGVSLMQPVGSAYVMFTVPVPAPVTTPLEEPTVATDVLELVQVPPVGVLDRLVLLPTQVLAVPLISDGSGFTVAVTVLKQPVLSI